MKTTRRGLFRSIFAAAALPYLPQPVARGVSLAHMRAFDGEAGAMIIGRQGMKIGETIYVRKPARFVATNGKPLVINQRFGVDFDFHTP